MSSDDGNRAPGSIWCLSRSNLGTYVRTEVDHHIVIVGPDAMVGRSAMFLSRKDARLLAKRINECLDDTAKR